tara:strand:+ start:630 stop:1064 length:435 start_codon:yes stop_codon:yes gene_type:complete
MVLYCLQTDMCSDAFRWSLSATTVRHPEITIRGDRMALIDCPSCGKKMSDKAKTCPNCDFSYGEASVEDIERKENMKRFKKMHSIQNQSMLAMLLFIGGFGFMYWGGVAPGDTQHSAALMACVIGFLWYGINRVRIVLLKRSSK